MVTVLVLEDDADIRRLVGFALERSGHRVVTTSALPEASEALTSQPVDVVVTDLQLEGGASGIDLVRQASGAGMRVVVITASLGEAERLALTDQVSVVLTKPFDLLDLLEAVDPPTAPLP